MHNARQWKRLPTLSSYLLDVAEQLLEGLQESF
jgi:hypothetical protein